MDNVQASGEQYTCSIPGLMVPRGEAGRSFFQNLEFIADWVQKNADNLQFLFEYHTKAFIFEMEMLHVLLGSIHARWLQNDAAKILKVTEVNSIDLSRNLLAPFIAKAHTLAIDIQMAQKVGFPESNEDQNESSGYHNYNEVARCGDVINSLSIISGLLDIPEGNPDYEKIMDIAVSNDELKSNESAISLFAGIVMKNAERVRAEIDKLAAMYYMKVDAINSPTSQVSGMKNLLIVDDMADVLTTLTLMLKNHYNIYALADGFDALELIDSGQRLDAILLDIDMPVMDGLTLAKNIRDRKQYLSTPILFLTGNSSKEAVFKASLYNPKAFIVKPASKDIILSKLSGCLN